MSMFDVNKKHGWKDIPIGGVIPEGGTATKYKTGEWRTERPVWDKEKCSQCMLCFIFCPDNSIEVKDEKMVGIDYEHCKGCGICAKECPRAAICMETDPKYNE